MVNIQLQKLNLLHPNKPNQDINFFPALSDPLVMCDDNFVHAQKDIMKVLTINLTLL